MYFKYNDEIYFILFSKKLKKALLVFILYSYKSIILYVASTFLYPALKLGNIN